MSNSVQYAGSRPVSNKSLSANQNTPAGKAIVSDSDQFNQKIKDSNHKSSKTPIQQQSNTQSQDTQANTTTPAQTGASSSSTTYQLVMQQLTTGRNPEAQHTGTVGAVAEQPTGNIGTATEQARNKIDINPGQAQGGPDAAAGQVSGKIDTAIGTTAEQVITGPGAEQTQNKASPLTEQVKAETADTVEPNISKTGTATEQSGSIGESSARLSSTADTIAEQAHSETGPSAIEEITLDKTAGSSLWANGSFGDDAAISQFLTQQAGSSAGSSTDSIDPETTGDTTDTQQATASTTSEAEIAETVAHLVIQQLGSLEALYNGSGFFGDTNTASQLLSEHLSGSLATEIASFDQEEDEDNR